MKRQWQPSDGVIIPDRKNPAAQSPTPNDTRVYPLTYDGGMVGFHIGENEVAVGPGCFEWYGHDGYTLAYFAYADGTANADWRRLVPAIDGRTGRPCVGGVEYAERIVFKRREASGEAENLLEETR